MKEEELKRLNELEQVIAWNNPADGGRTLTEEEQKEFAQLAMQFLLEGEDPEQAIIFKTIMQELQPKLPSYLEKIEKITAVKLSDKAAAEIRQILIEIFIHGAEVGAKPIE